MMNIRRYLLIIFLLLVSPVFFLAANDMPGFPSATLKMIGTINPRDAEIIITNEEGIELTAEDAILTFDFPATEQWEVSQSLYFYYSSNLSQNKSGKLTFQIDDFSMSPTNSLRINLEVEDYNSTNPDPSGSSFNIFFENGPRKMKEIGKLTVRIRKNVTDIYSAGMYYGYFSMNYIDMN